jgi:hypothetical protein
MNAIPFIAGAAALLLSVGGALADPRAELVAYSSGASTPLFEQTLCAAAQNKGDESGMRNWCPSAAQQTFGAPRSYNLGIAAPRGNLLPYNRCIAAKNSGDPIRIRTWCGLHAY